MKQKTSLLQFLLMFIFSMWLAVSTLSGCFGQSLDTCRVKICYSYLSCDLKDSSLQSIYNSKCLKIENGWMYGTLDGYIFLKEDKKPFIESIKIYYYTLI